MCLAREHPSVQGLSDLLSCPPHGQWEFRRRRITFRLTPPSPPHYPLPSGITVHFLFHGCHHKRPMDRLRLVFPPAPASVLVVLTRAGMLALWGPALGRALFGGTLLAYVLYDCIHYTLHHGKKGGGGSGRGGAVPNWLAHAVADFLAPLRRRHLDHHYNDEDANYGISSSLFDILCGTLREPDDK